MSVRFLCRAALFAAMCGSLAAAPIQWTTASGGNGHWYDYVPAPSIFSPVGFDAARSAALASTHMGMTGYLATITSAGEQQFVQDSFGFLTGFGGTATVFLGATDTAAEGEFRWLDGPESGQLVSYTNWLPGYPNTTSGDILHLYISYAVFGSPQYGWLNSGTQAFGYVVEYSGTGDEGVPEPGTVVVVVAGLAGILWKRRG